jgi:UDP-N-acetylmuramyl pentapeptide phosphotransferase/UDP-N-acetylglucosamine-1-phosphate transferase
MLILIFFISFLLIALIYFQSKYLVLIDTPHGQNHKSILNKNTPLSGGVYLFISITTYIHFVSYNKITILLSLFIFLLLILGIFSDLKRNFSPKLRLFLQFIIVLLFILLTDLKINKTGVFFLDYIIHDNLFNLLFTSLCVIIVINGSNFCDGVNCNVTGYFLAVSLGILFTKLESPTYFPRLEIIISIFFVFYVANLFQKAFLGDNGTYVISAFMSIYVISFINLNHNISPLLALNLLWYPAFENLFTIIRRLVNDKEVQIADRAHLHTLILKKISDKNNLIFSNSITGIILNVIMFLGIFLSVNFYNNAKVLLLVLLMNIILYVISYYFFYVRKKN